MASSAYRLVSHNVAELRAQPNRSSEQVSQLLLGAPVHTLESADGWTRVEGPDTYRGWIEDRWLCDSDGAFDSQVSVAFAEVLATLGGRLRVRLPRAARLRVVELAGDFARVRLPGGVEGWIAADAISAQTRLSADPAANAAEVSVDFLGTPYLWGGSSTYGLDCSGFVQLCYALAGFTLRRDADIQRDDPRFVPVAFEALAPGDLVFFGKPDRITHVGIHLEPGTFIHSAGGAGVILTQWGDTRYSPGYVDARRLNPDLRTDSVTRHEADDR